jgi:hypothetical protein
MSATQKHPDFKKALSDQRDAIPTRDAASLFAVGESSDVAAVHSPARALQRRLSNALDRDPNKRWSRRTTLLFIVTVCGGFWLALGTVIAALRH